MARQRTWFSAIRHTTSITSRSRKGEGGRKIKNDALGLQFEDFLRDACTNMLNVCSGAVYIAMPSSELHTLKRAFTDAGGHWSTFVIWAKQTFTLGRSDYQRQYEPSVRLARRRARYRAPGAFARAGPAYVDVRRYQQFTGRQVCRA